MNNETDTLLEVVQLVKQYPRVRAVDSVSLKVRTGRCFGMLGPNGAGKTTTIEIMEGITEPSAGTVLYKGAPRNEQFKREIGIQFQNTALQEKQTCREVLKLFGSLYPVTVDLATLIAACGLAEFIDRDTAKVSGGQRQRLLLAVALVNDPQLVFMDEPTTGLDPQARQAFWKIVRELKARGKTIVLTTHYMDEAHALCDELVIMDKGRILAQGKPDELLDHFFNGTTLRFSSDTYSPDQFPAVLGAHRDGDLIEMHVSDTAAALRSLMDAGIDLNGLRMAKPTLDDLFIHVTSQRAVSA